MLKFITIVLLLGAAAAAPSGLLLTRTHPELALVRTPLTYAEPATITKYDSISSPLHYTASHQPAIAYTNLESAQSAYLSYPGYSTGYLAGSPIRYGGLGFAY